MIYPGKNLKYTLFLDIETVPEFQTYDEMSELYQSLWDRKSHLIWKDSASWTKSISANLYSEKAGIYSEFAKVICISVGYFKDMEVLRIKSYFGHDEKQVLQQFSELIQNYYDDPKLYFLCGHNIKEFDIPFLCRRMVKHNVAMPTMFDIAGKKPWQTEHFVDTVDLWRFGDIKNYTSLQLLCAMLDVPTPKDDIDGSMVAGVYYEQQDLDRIKVYCQKDVISVARIMMKFSGLEPISDEQVELAEI